MIGIRPFIPLVALVASAVSASAQFAVELRMPRNTYVAGEDIPVTVSITNHSGAPLQFQGNTSQNWIDFTVMSNRGVAMTPMGQPVFGVTKPIPAGQTLTRTVSLSSIYGLQNMNNYSVYATVRMPGKATQGTLSNRLAFTVNSPRAYWTQKVGTAGGGMREFRVMNFSDGKKTMLYAQVFDERSGVILRTQSLGEVLMFRKPTITVDSKQVLHVLYQINPSVWGHARIAVDGAFLGRDLEKPGATDPQLITMGSGEVKTAGGVRYDPRAEAEASAKIRKSSDRPADLFQ